MLGLPRLLDRLEAALIAERPLVDLHRFPAPPPLETLFEIEARRLVRMGPDLAPLLQRLVAVGQDAAGAGLLPLAAAAAPRHLLARLGETLRRAGAWDPTAPLWWQPLPSRKPEDELWRRLDELLDAIPAEPDPRLLATAFADDPQAPRRLNVPGLLPDDLIAAVHGELERAFENGDLVLEAGTVGKEGRRSDRRTDAVRYLTGREGDLLAAAPRLAALAQWSLDRLAPRLAEHVPGTHPPRRVMLARYPAAVRGFAPHLDNPGGRHDNGRALSAVLYLNDPAAPCRGGELALWDPACGNAEDDADPAELVAPEGGTLVLFDARRVVHEVRTLAPGPARWTLALWMNDADLGGPPPPTLADPTLAELLLPIDSPPLPVGSMLLHELSDDEPAGRFHVARAQRPDLRFGVVTTSRGAGHRLDLWCRHHLDLGAAHLVVVFDRLEAPGEAETAARLRAAHPESRLTLWSSERLAEERWPRLDGLPEMRTLRRLAGSGRGSSQAVAARQTLNASAALAAARTDELGGAPLDWLLHLDDDELWALSGRARGGADPREHFAAVAETGARSVRYVNHELLLPVGAEGPRFKVNPHLARAKLGRRGWAVLRAQLAMDPGDPRPYFHGYVNGKAAVAVDAAAAAGGVHGWRLAGPFGGDAEVRLAGPAVLHLRYPTTDSFCDRYLAKAAGRAAGDGDLFAPSALEARAVERIRAARRDGATDEDLRDELRRLYRDATHFAPAEIELLTEAGLIVPGPSTLKLSVG